MISRRQFSTTLAGLAAGAVLARCGKARAERQPLRIAISAEMLAGVNVTDARASYRIWADQIAQTLALRHARFIDQVFVPSAEMIQMIRAGEVDFFALTALEFAKTADQIDPGWMLLEDVLLNGIDYLLLVHSDSPYRNLQDLKGAKLLMHHHPHDCLVRPWLAIQLANLGHKTFDEFFDSPESRDKVAEVVLPVFFRSIQAAALSRPAFEMAVELNPQLGRELRILAVSPKMFPNGFWARKSCNEEDKRVFEQAMLRTNTIPAGRQALALFQVTGYSSRSCSVMVSTLDLIRQYESLRKRAGGKPS
ncbi:MAG: PhnD/SsuA/transferrin family substrate-binding protein [Terracidiphilus sp.]